MKYPKISINDFTFMPCGYGRYRVTYTSPVIYKNWTKDITDMTLIDKTKNCENPTISSLTQLKRICKQYN